MKEKHTRSSQTKPMITITTATTAHTSVAR